MVCYQKLKVIGAVPNSNKRVDVVTNKEPYQIFKRTVKTFLHQSPNMSGNFHKKLHKSHEIKQLVRCFYQKMY